VAFPGAARIAVAGQHQGVAVALFGGGHALHQRLCRGLVAGGDALGGGGWNDAAEQQRGRERPEKRIAAGHRPGRERMPRQASRRRRAAATRAGLRRIAGIFRREGRLWNRFCWAGAPPTTSRSPCCPATATATGWWPAPPAPAR